MGWLVALGATRSVRNERLSAYLEVALDCVVMADASGRVVEFNPAAERTFGYSRDEALGRTLAELIVAPSLREAHRHAFARFVKTREPKLFGRRLELTGMRADGSEFPVELVLGEVEGDPLLICGALRDLSEAKRAEAELRELAAEQAALRGVATLVARGARPAEVFAAVAEAVAQILRLPGISMIRFESDRSATKIAGWGESPFTVGTRWTLDDPSVMASVMRTGRPARIDDYASLVGAHAERVREAGIRSGIGSPIVVDGKNWGVVIAFSTDPEPVSADAESRLARFTELVATAISNTQARDELQLLADEQAALRRVATQIAAEATRTDVFSTVAKEVAQTLDVPLTALVRFETDATATQVGVWGEENPFPLGTSWPLDEQSVSGQVWRTGKPARVNDYAAISGGIAATLAREAGIHTAVGAPVLVEGRPWGVVMALSTAQRPIPAGTENRLAAFTELVATAIANTQARDELRELVDEQAALRRVATLVARGSDSPAVFDAVCAETGPLIGASSVNLARFTPDGFNLTMAGWSVRDTHVPTGTRLPLGTETINGVIQRTGAPARVDGYETVSGELAALIRKRGIRSEVGAPVIVEGQVWGALIAGTDGDEPLPAGAERRVASFAELIATAVSNASTRSELIASRARIVAAGDEARRRIERNLHDGTQQRLIALGLDLQAVAAGIPDELADAHSGLERIGVDLESVLEDVRELSRGLHPGLLSQAGLGSSLRALARNSPVPVNLDVSVAERPAESIEIAVYYVVSEALANVAKHAQASEIAVTVNSSGGKVGATIEDDGIGGAEASAGSGLVGLIDRVEALGGRFALESPPGVGTRISVELPLTTQPVADVKLPQVTDADTLRAAVAASAEALYVVDPQGRIRFLNPAALRILGYEDERQLLGRPSHDSIHYLRCDGSRFPAADCPLLRPRLNGETVRIEEDCFVRQDGSLVPVSYSSAPVAFSEGRGAVVSFREAAQHGPD
jgi:PAS domain S-box-containing protein